MVSYEYKLKNAYIGSWAPSSDTKLYIPFETDLLEKSGNCTITNTGVTLGSDGGIPCGVFNGSSYIDTNVGCFSNPNHTFNVWFKKTSGTYGTLIGANPCGIYAGDVISYSDDYKFKYISWHNNTSTRMESGVINDSKWHNACYSGGKLYIDGAEVASGTFSTYVTGYNYCIGGHTTNSSCSRQFTTGYFSRVIIESVVWTAKQIQLYYTQTKSLYGIS